MKKENKYKLKIRHYQPIPIADDRLLIKSGGISILLKGKMVKQVLDSLLPLLNGYYSMDEISDRLPERFRETAKEILQSLDSEGLLMARPSFEGTTQGPKEQIAFFESCFGKPEIQKVLSWARICMIGEGRLGKALRQNLENAGIETIHAIRESEMADDLIMLPAETDLLIVCLEHIRPDLSRLVNLTCLKLKVPWLLVGIDGQEGWTGPLFLPGETGCHTCFQNRLLANSSFPEIDMASYSENGFREKHSFGTLNPFYGLVSAMASLEAIRHITGISRPVTYGAQVVMDCVSGNLKREILHRIPRCPDCSAIGEQVSSIQAFSG